MVDLSFSRLQTALFLTSLDSTRMLELATAIRNAAGGLLDADPMMLPLPSDSPPEIPRLTLRSSDRQWACQMSGNRLDLVFELSPDDLGTADFSDTAERQAHICSGIWKAIESDTSELNKAASHVLSNLPPSWKGTSRLLFHTPLLLNLSATLLSSRGKE